MGAFTAPICHLLSPSSSSSSSSSSPPPNPTLNPNSEPHIPNPRKTLFTVLHPINISRPFPPPPLAIQRRHLLLFSLPISLTLHFTSSSALAYFDLVSPAERDASSVLSRRVNEAVELLEKGRELQAQGDFNHALYFFTQVTENYKDLALSDYARVGRALALYEVGDREEAITEMEDVSISLKGYPEVHAALAAALYMDKHAALLAENQFTIATLLDPHYTDISYVKETKHWPPSLVSSLQHFITLS